MIAWMIVGSYLAAWIYTARTFALRMLDEEARTELAHRESMASSRRPADRAAFIADRGPLVQDWERRGAVGFGAMVGLIWPVYWLGRVAMWLASLAGIGLKTPTELGMEQRAELEALRKLAKEHDLPMPGGGS